MDIKFDLNALTQAAIDTVLNDVLFELPGIDKKSKKVMKGFFRELNSRGVSTQTILECLAEAAKENPE